MGSEETLNTMGMNLSRGAREKKENSQERKKQESLEGEDSYTISREKTGEPGSLKGEDHSPSEWVEKNTILKHRTCLGNLAQ